jgi:two-component system cell cycle sensor histidine kinase/response regulator CckA
MSAERPVLDSSDSIDYAEAYRRLFAAHPVPMAVWDPETGMIVDANDAATSQYGYDRSELVGLPIGELVHPDDLPRLRARLPRLPDGYAGAEIFRHLRRDGTVIEVEVSGHPIEYDGRPARLVLANDVTARRRLEEQLRQSQKMEAVGRLAGGVAHDFNNLLMAIMGFSELLLERLEHGTEEREAAAEIHRAGTRAAALTSQLLAFSRPRTGEATVFDLNELVESLRSTLRGMLGEHIAIRIEPAATRPFIEAHRAQIEQVLVSCAVNARDAMPNGGELRIETQDVPSVAARALGGVVAEGRHVMIAISDSGVGMDAAVRDRAFDPFFTTKQPGGTTGLGLAMAYSAVEQAGGRIRLESSPGQGSTVRIFLPVSEPPADEIGQPPIAETPDHVRRSTILVAEDEPAVRALVEKVLRDAGHTVLVAQDGTAALDLAARHKGRIDLLLTDIVMPGPSGIETARRMTADRPGIRVLYMSGWATETFRREGVDESEIALLPKPFSVAELIARVASALAEPAPG